MILRYRMKQPGEEQELLRLWAEHSGWGSPLEGLWHGLLTRGSLGEAPVVLAEDVDSGAVVGQLAFLRSVVSVSGRPVRALRPFAAILSAEVRRAGIDPQRHPMIEMYFHAIEKLLHEGIGFVYFLPDPRWRRVLRSFPFLLYDEFPMYQMRVPLEHSLAMPSGHRAAPLEAWDERVDALVADSARFHPCLVSRDARRLEERARLFKLRATGVRRGDDLVGLALWHRVRDDVVLADILARSDATALRATLTGGIRAVHEESAASGTHRKLRVVAVPRLQSWLTELGFERGDYVYPLAIHILDSNLDPADVAPEKWYLTAYD